EVAHVPLVCNREGRRLSKRDASLSMESLRRDYNADRLLGIVASLAGLCDNFSPVTLTQLLELFSWERLRSLPVVTV
ncbi:MAG: hypothetical protein K2H75_06760, partial [Muribaculaceae bacterium]|nr:hypothetical protein [Muribaculaceae bacterium]